MRKRDRERETERERDIERKREREIETERERDIERKRDREEESAVEMWRERTGRHLLLGKTPAGFMVSEASCGSKNLPDSSRTLQHATQARYANTPLQHATLAC